MSASDTKAGRQGHAPASEAKGDVADSLTRTLEDLEARLSRLSEARREPPSFEAGAEERGASTLSHPATTRLRAIEQRLSGASRLALDTARTGEDRAVRRGRSGAALDRRIGTIAGEVEALKLQGSTLQLVSTIAEDIQFLRAEIVETVGARTEVGFEEIREAFEDLCERIAETDQSGIVADQISQILRRLSEMQSSGLDKRTLEVLRGDLEKVAGLVSETAREETVLTAARRWEDFEARLEAHIELDGAAKRDLQAELERLRTSVRSLASEEQVRAVERRWDEFEARHFEQLNAQTESRIGQLLRADLKSLGERIDGLAEAALCAQADRSEQAADARRTADALARLTTRLGDLEEALDALPDNLGIERLELRLEELAESVVLMARQQQEPDLEHFTILEERLDEISQAIVSAAVREAAAIDMAPIERIEARLAELAARVDHLTSPAASQELSHQIAGLSSRIEEMASLPIAAGNEDRFASFSARIDAVLERMEQPRADLSVFEERLTALAARLEEVAASQVDEEVLRSLETQIARLALQLSAGPVEGPTEADGEIARRLASIEERLEQNRTDVMAAARAAADEAVRLMLPESTPREGEHIRNLSEDLRSLEALCRETDDRSIKVFDAVHSTLVKIAERLGAIETDIRSGSSAPQGWSAAPSSAPMERLPELEALVAGAPQGEHSEDEDADGSPLRKGLRAAIAKHFSGRPVREQTEASVADVALPFLVDAPVSAAEPPARRTSIEDAPSIDPADSILFREANRPLEPGSGAPDIASLIDRVRMQQQQRVASEAAEPASKADFISAARKAALAAAAEADTLRQEETGSAGDLPDQTAGHRRFGRHRKPILMAVGAVLLAMMAIPLGRVLAPTTPSDAIVETAELATIEAPAPSAPAIAGIAQGSPGASAPEAIEGSAQTAVVEPESEPVQPALSSAPLVEAERPQADRPSIAELAAARASGPTAPELHTASLARQASMTPQRPAPSVADTAPAVEAQNNTSVTAAVAGPSMTGDDMGPVLTAAIERLPENTRGALPSAPSGVGPTALVAAADAGDPKAIFEIGLRLMEGRSGPSDMDAALLWFANAGRLGYAPAQYSLGTLFEKGNGIERDTVAARDWYRLSAEQGNVRAMHNLAVLYATGVDGQSDPVAAARWFTAAAEHGMRDSQYNLGILHARGAGVEQDLGQSYKWFAIVGATGDRDASEKRDEVAKALSADEIASIDAEVAGWQPIQRSEAANSVDIPAAWAEPGDQTASVEMTRAIRNVQAILARLGFDPGTPDGIAGTRTTDAVRAFQEQQGLTPTGAIDETLIRELLKQNV